MDELTIQSASAIQQSKIAGQVAAAVAKKSMDVQKMQGQAAVALVQSADISRQVADGYLDVQV